MKRTFLLLALLLTACDIQMPSAGAGSDVRVGDKPAINFTGNDGRPITNDSLQGKVIVLDFWASWCGPCIQQVPHMLDLHKKHGDKAVFLGVNIDQSKPAMDRAVRQHGLPWTQVFDGDSRISHAWGVDSIPRIFILGRVGTVAWTGHPAEMDAALAKAVGAG